MIDGPNKYEYDAFNRRTKKVTYASGSPVETRHYYYGDGSQVQEEYVGTTSATSYLDRSYVWGPNYLDELVLRDRDTDADHDIDSSDERLYAIHDENYSVTALINTSGAVVKRYLYDPYGKATALNPDFTTYSGSDYKWDVTYTGQRLDSETGFYYFKNRYYSAELGKFVTRDPIGYAGGGANLYAGYFVPGSMDPLGLKPPMSDYPWGKPNLTADEAKIWYPEFVKDYPLDRINQLHHEMLQAGQAGLHGNRPQQQANQTQGGDLFQNQIQQNEPKPGPCEICKNGIVILDQVKIAQHTKGYSACKIGVDQHITQEITIANQIYLQMETDIWNAADNAIQDCKDYFDPTTPYYGTLVKACQAGAYATASEASAANYVVHLEQMAALLLARFEGYNECYRLNPCTRRYNLYGTWHDQFK